MVSTEEARQNMVDGKQPGLSNVTFEHHATIYLGGKTAELYHWGRAHTNGDAVVLFSVQRVLASGDMFTYGGDVPELIDYSGGGSGQEWTRTLDSALKLDFDRVVPGHGNVTTKTEMQNSTLNLRNCVHEMIAQKKTKGRRENAPHGVPFRGFAHRAQLERADGGDAVIELPDATLKLT